MFEIIVVQDFYLLKIKITQFHGGFRLKSKKTRGVPLVLQFLSTQI